MFKWGDEMYFVVGVGGVGDFVVVFGLFVVGYVFLGVVGVKVCGKGVESVVVVGGVGVVLWVGVGFVVE